MKTFWTWVAVMVLAEAAFLTLSAMAAFGQESASMDPLPNRVVVYGGYGPDGLTVAPNKDGSASVSAFYAPLVGLGYERRVYDHFSASVLGFTGASTKSRSYFGAIGLGYDF